MTLAFQKLPNYQYNITISIKTKLNNVKTIEGLCNNFQMMEILIAWGCEEIWLI